MVEINHKPLEVMVLKNITPAPPCFQQMHLCLQQYYITDTGLAGKRNQVLCQDTAAYDREMNLP